MDAGASIDGDAEMDRPDASADAAPDLFADAGPDPDAGASPPVEPGRQETDDGALSCFDGEDGDLDSLIDCQDPSCGASDYCCVGSSEPHCCTAISIPVDLAFAVCPEGDADLCPEVGPVFGGPTAQIEEGHFVPNGTTDSGAAIGRTLDPTRERLTVSAVVFAPDAPCADCTDVVAVGLGDLPPPNTVRVVPDVALMVRRAHRDVALIVAGEVVATRPLTTDVDVTHTLRTSPSGSLTWSVSDSGSSLEASFLPRPARRLLIYGRTPNRSAVPQHVYASSVRVVSAGCEIPGALLPDASPLPLPGRSPSVVRDGDRMLMALVDDGAIYLAASPDGVRDWALVEATPVLSNGQLDDPELFMGSDGGLVLYATRELAGAVSVVRARRLSARFGDPSVVTMPRGVFRAPSVAELGGRLLMAAVAEETGHIVVLESHDGGTTFVHLADAVAPGLDYMHFDDDAVADPDLVVDAAGLLRLYYAGRRGTRWAIGMRLSGNGAVFRDPLGAGVAALSPSGVGHDALGVRAPSALIEAGTIHLFHTASDGVRATLGRAEGATR